MNDYDAGEDEQVIATRVRLSELRQEHQDLGVAVQALLDRHAPDMILIARMKKRKLALRDQIAVIEDQLTPDIIA